MVEKSTTCQKLDPARKIGTRMHVIKAPTKEIITHSLKKDGDHVTVVKA